MNKIQTVFCVIWLLCSTVQPMFKSFLVRDVTKERVILCMCITGHCLLCKISPVCKNLLLEKQNTLMKKTFSWQQKDVFGGSEYYTVFLQIFLKQSFGRLRRIGAMRYTYQDRGRGFISYNV